MIYTYRVTLAGIKGFYRVYKVDGSNSLYTFHKQLRADLEFTVDQPILFKAFDAEENVAGLRITLLDKAFQCVGQWFVARLVGLNNLMASLADGDDVVVFVDDLHLTNNLNC